MNQEFYCVSLTYLPNQSKESITETHSLLEELASQYGLLEPQLSLSSNPHIQSESVFISNYTDKLFAFLREIKATDTRKELEIGTTGTSAKFKYKGIAPLDNHF